MKDSEANIGLIRHVSQRIDEFFDEYESDQFKSAEDLHHVFSLWLHRKDSLEAPREVGKN